MPAPEGERCRGCAVKPYGKPYQIPRSAAFLTRVVGSHGGYPTTFVIRLGISPFIWRVSLWEALSVVSQQWSFPTALTLTLSFNSTAGKKRHLDPCQFPLLLFWRTDGGYALQKKRTPKRTIATEPSDTLEEATQRGLPGVLGRDMVVSPNGPQPPPV